MQVEVTANPVAGLLKTSQAHCLGKPGFLKRKKHGVLGAGIETTSNPKAGYLKSHRGI
jgi:hypothetical protein